jgi:hypothetical protein
VMIQDFLIEEVVPYVMSLRSFPIPNSTTWFFIYVSHLLLKTFWIVYVFNQGTQYIKIYIKKITPHAACRNIWTLGVIEFPSLCQLLLTEMDKATTWAVATWSADERKETHSRKVSVLITVSVSGCVPPP